LFEEMLVGLREQVTSALSHVEFTPHEPPPFGPFGAEPPPGPTPFGGLSYSETVAAEPEPAFADAEARPLPRGGANEAGGAGRGRGRRRGNGNAGDGAGGSERRERAERAAEPRAPWVGRRATPPVPAAPARSFKHCTAASESGYGSCDRPAGAKGWVRSAGRLWVSLRVRRGGPGNCRIAQAAGRAISA